MDQRIDSLLPIKHVSTSSLSRGPLRVTWWQPHVILSMKWGCTPGEKSQNHETWSLCGMAGTLARLSLWRVGGAREKKKETFTLKWKKIALEEINLWICLDQCSFQRMLVILWSFNKVSQCSYFRKPRLCRNVRIFIESCFPTSWLCSRMPRDKQKNVSWGMHFNLRPYEYSAITFQIRWAYNQL